MMLQIDAEQIPLVVDADGVVRVGGTLVTLDTVIAAFSDGATSEEIVQQYPSLHLADVYAILGFYLRKQREVGAYLRDRQQKADDVRRPNEARFDPQGVRDRLLARHSEQRAVRYAQAAR